MKVNILDLNKLSIQIDFFMKERGRNPNYLIMKQSTEDALAQNFNDSFNKHIDCRSGIIGEFRGVPIAIHEGLSFGVIDIV